MKTIHDLLNESGAAATGSAPLQRLLQVLDDDGAIVTWLHGSPGSGKGPLLDDFAARIAPVPVVQLDCRTVEPTQAGLARELGDDGEDLAAIAGRLSGSARQLVIVFRNYEVLRLADSWLRREFFPALGANVRVVLSSTEHPSAGWLSAAKWQPFFGVIALGEGDPTLAVQRMLDEASDTDLRRILEDLSVVTACHKTDAGRAKAGNRYRSDLGAPCRIVFRRSPARRAGDQRPFAT